MCSEFFYIILTGFAWLQFISVTYSCGSLDVSHITVTSDRAVSDLFGHIALLFNSILMHGTLPENFAHST